MKNNEIILSVLLLILILTIWIGYYTIFNKSNITLPTATYRTTIIPNSSAAIASIDIFYNCLNSQKCYSSAQNPMGITSSIWLPNLLPQTSNFTGYYFESGSGYVSHYNINSTILSLGSATTKGAIPLGYVQVNQPFSIIFYAFGPYWNTSNYGIIEIKSISVNKPFQIINVTSGVSFAIPKKSLPIQLSGQGPIQINVTLKDLNNTGTIGLLGNSIGQYLKLNINMTATKP